ncbi:MAG: 50S ribosomal protein L32 [candidate division SR1 bacterium]|nr:MAG: 50S ribosomal protein L32 [candidate division SR1 bacterium]
MIGPKKKISKSQRNKRHSTWEGLMLKKLTKKYAPVKCGNCGANTLPHRVCKTCGYYKGKQVVTIKSKSKQEVLDA